MNPTTERGRGRARLLQGERTTEAVSSARTSGGSSWEGLSEGYKVHLKGTLPDGGVEGVGPPSTAKSMGS